MSRQPPKAPGPRVLVAPNAFKGSLSPAAAARAMASGIRRAWPQALCRELPLSDGGDGFGAALATIPGSSWTHSRARGPLLEEVRASTLWLPGGRTAVIELARTCGLRRVPRPGPASSVRTSTFGLGEQIRTALEHGARRIVVGLGGSASTDGGAGAAQALGFRLLDRSDRPIPAGGGGLVELCRIEVGTDLPALQGIEIEAACDVDNPLLGPRGAAASFGPQKGAGAAELALLEEGLRRLATVVARDLGEHPSPFAWGMGAAGGTGFGLAAFAGAKVRSGAGLVAEALALEGALDWTELVVTGEGRLDLASFGGKATGEILRQARSRGLPTLLVAGSAEDEAVVRLRQLGAGLVLTADGGLPPTSGLEASHQLRRALELACRDPAIGGRWRQRLSPG